MHLWVVKDFSAAGWGYVGCGCASIAEEFRTGGNEVASGFIKISWTLNGAYFYATAFPMSVNRWTVLFGDGGRKGII